jgi:uncharacterized protein DUF6194
VTIEPIPDGPDAEALIALIRETWPETDVATMPGAAFFSLDPAKHWPNFATIVWTDDFDDASNLSRPGVFRVNMGVGRASFAQLVGAMTNPDYTVMDRILPHPVYARQRWISILNPTAPTMRDIVMPLLAEVHDRLAAQRARSRPARRSQSEEEMSE